MQDLKLYPDFLIKVRILKEDLSFPINYYKVEEVFRCLKDKEPFFVDRTLINPANTRMFQTVIVREDIPEVYQTKAKIWMETVTKIVKGEDITIQRNLLKTGSSHRKQECQAAQCRCHVYETYFRMSRSCNCERCEHEQKMITDADYKMEQQELQETRQREAEAKRKQKAQEESTQKSKELVKKWLREEDIGILGERFIETIIERKWLSGYIPNFQSLSKKERAKIDKRVEAQMNKKRQKEHYSTQTVNQRKQEVQPAKTASKTLKERMAQVDATTPVPEKVKKILKEPVIQAKK